MSQLLLVNPRRRKARKSPAKRRTTRRRNPVGALAANPRRRRRVARVASRPVRRRRRNPIGSAGLMDQVKTAALGAGGALGVEVLFGFLPLPAMLQTGYAKHAAKAGGAIALGMLAKNFLGSNTGNQLATGALTVFLHDALKEFAGNSGLNLGEYIDESSLYGLGEYIDESSMYDLGVDEPTFYEPEFVQGMDAAEPDGISL